MKTWTLRHTNSNAGSNSLDQKIQLRRWGMISSLFAACLSGYFIYEKNQSGNHILNQSITQPLVEERAAAEKQIPTDYVTGQIKMRRNFIDELVVEGSLRNIATSTNYKDVVLRVDFLSSSGAVLFTKDYPVRETLKPNIAAKFKFKNPSLKEVDRVCGKILQAEPCN